MPVADPIADPAPVALVTGAAHGIGLEVCRQFAARGYTVVLTARDAARAEEAAARLAEHLGGDAGRVRGLRLDVNDPADVHHVAAALAADPGRLDVLVNNAAAYVDWAETASAADLDAAHAVLETNLFGAWRTAQALLPLLRASGRGRLVNVASGAGSHGDAAFGLGANGGAAASYGISKAALGALTAKLAAERANATVRINAVCPGLTATAPGMEAMGARPVAEGAASVVWAALLPDDGPTGGFFRDGEPLPW